MRIIGRLILREMRDEVIDDSRPLVLFGPDEYLPNIEKNGWPEAQIIDVVKIANDCVKCEGVDESSRIGVYFFIIDGALAEEVFPVSELMTTFEVVPGLT